MPGTEECVTTSMEFEFAELTRRGPFPHTRLSVLNFHGYGGLTSSAVIRAPSSEVSSSPQGCNEVPVLGGEAPADPFPVPLITVGHVFAPIPSGRMPIAPEAMEAARMMGLAPMLAAAAGSANATADEFLDVAALTDPLNAANLIQGDMVAGRRVLFVERGAATQLALGRVRVIPGTKAEKRGGKRSVQQFLDFLNPLKAMGGVLKALQNDSVTRSDMAEMVLPPRPSASTYHLEERKGKSRHPPSRSKRGREDEGFPSGLEWPSDQLAHLAKIPVRLALALLHGAPGRFLLLAGRGNGSRQGVHRKGNNGDGMGAPSTNTATTYVASDAFADLKVHTLAGFEIALHGATGPVLFIPAFLSELSLRNAWRQAVAVYGAGLLSYRRLQRRTFRQRLQHAAAMIAGAGEGPSGAGGGGASKYGEGKSPMGIFPPREDADEEEEGGFDEPPELHEAIRELGNELETLGVVGGGSGGNRASNNGFIRAVATLTCGMITIIGPAVEGVGDVIDRAIVSLPGGSWMLGIPGEAKIEGHNLLTVLREMDEYNSRRTDGDVHARPPLRGDFNKNNTLAFHALCAAALTKFALDLIRPGPVGFLQAAWFMGKLESGTDLMSGGMLPPAVGSHLPQTVDAMTTDSINGNQAPSSLLAAILRDVLPNLEHNEFDDKYFRWCGGGRFEEEGLREMLKTVFEENQKLGIEIRLGSWVHTSSGAEGPSLKEEMMIASPGDGDASGSAERTIGKVLVVIGDVEGGLGDRNALLGPPVGVEDGRKYL